MTKRPQKISLVLGPLSAPLAKAATANGHTLSEEIRQRLAISLGVEAPDVRVGNPEIGSMSAAALRKRWKRGQ